MPVPARSSDQPGSGERTRGRRAALRRPWLPLLVVLVTAPAARGDHGFVRDLLPALADADVCATADDCAPARDAAGSRVVHLTATTGRRLYVRLPERPTLDLDVTTVDATVRFEVTAEGTSEQRIATATAPGALHVDLAPFAGRIARVDVRVAAGEADVRRALLSGGLSDDPPLIASTRSGARRPNVVIYVIDTLRPDHLGCYGYPLPTSPHIDDFARTAVRFTRATAVSSWTLPTVASILTGLRPEQHGALDPDHAVRPEIATLPAILAANGWTTAAFVTNYLGSDVFGLGRGFAEYHFYAERGTARRAVYLRSDALFRRVARWLARRARSPFLLYVHATDPHFPYLPPPRAARPFLHPLPSDADVDALTARVRHLHNGRDDWGTRPAPVADADLALLRALYDGEVRFADEYFGRLVDVLRDRGFLDDTIIVLTSDHGEEFMEHGGVGHGQTLHDEVLHVPLLIRMPGGAGGGTRVDRLVSQTDMLPTVLAAAGVPVPRELDGTSWLGPQPSAASVESAAMLLLGGFDAQAVVGDGWKAIRDFTKPAGHRVRLFDTTTDPGERRDDDAASALLLGYARARLRELALLRRPGPRVADERIERLRALGYVAE